ncbi:helix-turn-helix domain-containing protein [Mesorhizobium sp.]|uniref:helix-turn-helix domain-containing protein n=1 Tax=Mesorhizobium sp. TaxID=1871066 RepID=UPI00338E99F7
MCGCGLQDALRTTSRIYRITQAALGDAVGLSAVHVNRTLQALRGDGLIATPGTKLRALDWPGLVRAGEFDPTYLHQKDPEVAF